MKPTVTDAYKHCLAHVKKTQFARDVYECAEDSFALVDAVFQDAKLISEVKPLV